MPRFDTRSQHTIEVHAPAQAVLHSRRGGDREGSVVPTRARVHTRTAPAWRRLRRLDVPIVDAPLILSFTRGAVLLGARPPEEVLAGAIGRFWRLAGNEPVAFGSPEEFPTFTEPGFAKAVVGFRLDPRGAEILLTTETRFVATDEATRRLMSRYWRIIRPGSNLIRTEWLRAIRRRALRRPNSVDRGFRSRPAALPRSCSLTSKGKEEKHGFNRYLQPSASPRRAAQRRNNKMNDTKQSTEDLAILEQLNKDFFHSDQFNDVKRFSEFLAEDFISQFPGVTRNRAEFLDYIAQPRPFKDLAMHDVNIRILSDVALIHGRSTYTMLADGVEQEALYTDAYQKREGTWVCVAACAIAPGA